MEEKFVNVGFLVEMTVGSDGCLVIQVRTQNGQVVCVAKELPVLDDFFVDTLHKISSGFEDSKNVDRV